jgi:hypothetical protein
VFLIIAYTFSSTKLEIRAEQIWPESEGGWLGGEMAQTMFAHMNNGI